MNKNDFPIFSNNAGLIYLDSAASAQKPLAVIDAMDDFVKRHYANVHRGTYYLSEMATIAYENARHTVADFLSVADRDIIFTRGATESINLVAQTFGRTLNAGDEIILSEAEHHSNIVPWQMLALERGVVVKYAEVCENGKLNLDDLKVKLSPKTKLVSIAQMSNVLGVENPVAQISKLAHSVGAKVLIDGCQGVVHSKIDLKANNIDFYAFSGHKIYGPTGIGVLYAPADFMNTMQPWQGGGDMIKSVSFEKTTYAEAPARFEAGTPAIVEAVGLAAALNYVRSVGQDEIETIENQTMQLLKDGLEMVSGVEVLGDIKLKKSLVCFNLHGLHPQDVAMILSEQNVAVRVGHHCAQPITEKYGVTSSIRASLGMYNTGEDITAFIAALKKAQKILGSAK